MESILKPTWMSMVQGSPERLIIISNNDCGNGDETATKVVNAELSKMAWDPGPGTFFYNDDDSALNYMKVARTKYNQPKMTDENDYFDEDGDKIELQDDQKNDYQHGEEK